MKLIAYTKDDWNISIRPAPVNREWMDKTTHKYAYRCLPLNIANQFGWEILSLTDVYAYWNGRDTHDCVQVKVEDPMAGTAATSHFGHGILTFSIPALFRTDDGYDLMVQGPINNPKDSIVPLTGVVETNWSPYTFTMNWKFTRERVIVKFEKGEPICHIFPVPRRYLETFEPEIRSLDEVPELRDEYNRWEASRNEFNTKLKEEDPSVQKKGWQKNYFKNLTMNNQKGSCDHMTKLDLKEFKQEK